MALTGAFVGEKCFNSQAEGLDYFYSNAAPAYTAGATSYASQYVKTAGVWKINRQSISSTGVITNLTASNAPVLTFPSCDPSGQYMDGIAVGWGIAAAVIAAVAFKAIHKAGL